MDCACLTLKKQVRIIVGNFGCFPFEVGSYSEAQVLLNSVAVWPASSSCSPVSICTCLRGGSTCSEALSTTVYQALCRALGRKPNESLIVICGFSALVGEIIKKSATGHKVCPMLEGGVESEA